MSKMLRVEDETHDTVITMAKIGGRTVDQIIRDLLAGQDRLRRREQVRRDAARLAADEADRAEMRAVAQDMEALRAR